LTIIIGGLPSCSLPHPTEATIDLQTTACHLWNALHGPRRVGCVRLGRTESLAAAPYSAHDPEVRMSFGKPLIIVKDIPTQRLYTKKQAAQYLGICEKTLKEMTQAGELPTYMHRGRRVYRLEDLDRFINKLPVWHAPHHDPVA
jgi:excisionase family DNA binding protein